MRYSLALLPLLLAGCTATTGEPPAPPAPKLFTQNFGTPLRAADTLYVVVHGDRPVGTPADMSAFAGRLAAAAPGSAVVALLRPGYDDPAGNRSPGIRGDGAGDDYTADRIAAVGDAIAALRARHPRARVVGIGEGGGAAIIANLAGVRSGLLDGIVLVSCPCALPEWRRHMATREKPAQPWKEVVESLDPLKTAGGIAPNVRAAVLIGSDDRITLPRFSRAYAEALSLRGIATDFRILPGKGNGILGDPEVIDAARRLAAALPRKPA